MKNYCARVNTSRVSSVFCKAPETASYKSIRELSRTIVFRLGNGEDYGAQFGQSLAPADAAFMEEWLSDESADTPRAPSPNTLKPVQNRTKHIPKHQIHWWKHPNYSNRMQPPPKIPKTHPKAPGDLSCMEEWQREESVETTGTARTPSLSTCACHQ